MKKNLFMLVRLVNNKTGGVKTPITKGKNNA